MIDIIIAPRCYTGKVKSHTTKRFLITINFNEKETSTYSVEGMLHSKWQAPDLLEANAYKISPPNGKRSIYSIEYK